MAADAANWIGLPRAWNTLMIFLRCKNLVRQVIQLRTQRDIERVKLALSTIIAPDRAITLLATGDRIYVDPRDRGCGSELMHQGRYEENDLRLFRAYLTPHAVVLDVGANYGYYSLCAAPFVRPAGRVIAFEPNPHICELLRSSVALNAYENIVDVRPSAASDITDRLCFVVDETGPGGAHVDTPMFPAPEGWLRLLVPVEPLDRQLPGDLIVDLVKIDVEGHETRALAGMRSIIARSPDIKIFMEFIYEFLGSQEAFSRLFDLIEGELGLQINRVLPDGQTERVTPDELRGAACTLILSKSPLVPVAEVTVSASHLKLSSGAELIDECLCWRRGADAPKRQTLCSGGGLYAPRGFYTLVVDGKFSGPFLLRICSQGEILWQGAISGTNFSRRISLAVDAPKLEVVVIATGYFSRSARITSIALWQ